MMKMDKTDIDAILAPIPGENPAGEDVRYSPFYEQIKEARRADDQLNQGDWQHEIKKSDWDMVIKVTTKALQEKTKDLQIAAWLTEALIKKEGFGGLAVGLTIIVAFIGDYWETLYPLPEDGDLEYRLGPLEFLNDKVSPTIRDIPISDDKVTTGYSWYKWQESRQKAGEGKITSEVFDSAVSQSSKDYYIALADDLDACMEAFSKLDIIVDEKFGKETPRISALKKAIEDCQYVVGGILKEKGGRSPALEPSREESKEDQILKPVQEDKMEIEPVESAKSLAVGMSLPSGQILDQGDIEVAVWNDAQQTLKDSGIKTALLKLLNASISASSIRQKNRYRLMMAKLAIQAARPDLARPILEELYALIQELHLDQWETPVWIAEVIEAYYQCLKSTGAPESDKSKADNELFPKLCSKDITKAFLYKKGG